MNPSKDTKLQSSLQFFHARIKNQYEDLKLQRELHLLDRRIGMANSEFKREFRAIRREMLNMRKSSGRSEEGRPPDDEEVTGNLSSGKQNSENAGKEKRTTSRARSAIVGTAPKTETSVWERLKRPKSAPDVLKPVELNEKREAKVFPERMTESPTTKTRLNAKTCSKLAWNKWLHDERRSASNDAVKTRQGARSPSVGVSRRIMRPHTAETEGFLTGKTTTALHKGRTGGHDTSETKRLESAPVTLQPVPEDPPTRERTPCPPNSRPRVPKIKPLSKPTKVTKSGSLRDLLKATPLCEGSPTTSDAPSSPTSSDVVRERWLKSALKSRQNHRTPKRVTILDNGELYEHSKNADNNTCSGQENNTADIGEPDNSGNDSREADKTENAPSLALLSLLMGNSVEPATSSTPNVIPDVRRNPLQTVEDASMKKRRDSLLKASIVSLMSGGLKRRKSSLDVEAVPQTDVASQQDDSVSSTGKTSPARIRFRTLGKVVIPKNYITVQKRSTLGSRLKIHPVLQSAMTTKSIKANLALDDDDSDTDEAGTSPTPKANGSIRSKISQSWRQDLDLEKPPALEDDLKQLQIHLAASHLSRERELQRMQQEQEVNHMQVVDDERKQGVMAKVTMFVSALDERREAEMQEQKRMEVFGRPARNPVVQRWRDAARGVIKSKH